MLIQVGSTIQITERKCSDKVQPHIHVGDIFLIHEMGKTTTGIRVLTLYAKGKEYKCNASRFSWKAVDIKAIKAERDKKSYQAAKVMLDIAEKNEWEQCKNVLMSGFNFQEQCQVALLPLVIYDIAWRYALQCVKFAADNRISEVKALSRSVKMLHEDYRRYLQHDLDFNHRKMMNEQVEQFYAENSYDMTILFHTTVNAVNHQHIGISYDELRANAYLCILMVRILVDHENKMTDFMRMKLGQAIVVHLPHEDALIECMAAYIGDFYIAECADVRNRVRIIQNRLKQMKFIEGII